MKWKTRGTDARKIILQLLMDLVYKKTSRQNYDRSSIYKKVVTAFADPPVSPFNKNTYPLPVCPFCFLTGTTIAIL